MRSVALSELPGESIFCSRQGGDSSARSPGSSKQEESGMTTKASTGSTPLGTSAEFDVSLRRAHG